MCYVKTLDDIDWEAGEADHPRKGGPRDATNYPSGKKMVASPSPQIFLKPLRPSAYAGESPFIRIGGSSRRILRLCGPVSRNKKQYTKETTSNITVPTSLSDAPELTRPQQNYPMTMRHLLFRAFAFLRGRYLFRCLRNGASLSEHPPAQKNHSRPQNIPKDHRHLTPNDPGGTAPSMLILARRCVQMSELRLSPFLPSLPCGEALGLTRVSQGRLLHGFVDAPKSRLRLF